MTLGTPHRQSSPRLLLALCVASAMLAVSTPAFADSSHDPAITEARADAGMLHILGLNLGGGKPRVTLGTLPLSVVSVTATQIDALVPATVAPGSYLLTVSLAKGKSGGDDRNDEGKYDEFWVTIGAAGPQGEMGAVGPAGATGPMGAPGATGAAGKDGATGPAGAKGDVGSQGLTGLTGAPGAQGNAGAPGNAGPLGPQGPQGTLGPQGPQGPQGAQGPQGFVGPQGPAGSSLRTMVSSDFTVPTASWENGQIQCPANYPQLVSAGAYPHAAPVAPASGYFAYEPPGTVMYSYPSGTGGWRVTVRNETGRPFNAMTVTFTILAVCST